MRTFYERNNNFQSTSSHQPREIVSIFRRRERPRDIRGTRVLQKIPSLSRAIVSIFCTRSLSVRRVRRGFARYEYLSRCTVNDSGDFAGTERILTSGQVKNCSSVLMNRWQVEDAEQRWIIEGRKKKKIEIEDRRLKNWLILKLLQFWRMSVYLRIGILRKPEACCFKDVLAMQ